MAKRSRSGNPAIRAAWAAAPRERSKLGAIRGLLAQREKDLAAAQAELDRTRVLVFGLARAEGLSSVEAARLVGFSRSTFHRRYGL